jgi:hypothetical protein
VPGSPLCSLEPIKFSPGTRWVGELGVEFVAEVTADESVVTADPGDMGLMPMWRLLSGYGRSGIEMAGGSDRVLVWCWWEEVAERWRSRASVRVSNAFGCIESFKC